MARPRSPRLRMSCDLPWAPALPDSVHRVFRSDPPRTIETVRAMGKVTSSNKPMDVAAAIESALKGCPDCKEPVANERGIATQREALRTASGLEGPICQALEAGSVRLLRHRRLKANVHRLWAEVDGVRRSLIAKRSQPEVARRNWLVAHRWLSIAHLDGLG